MSKRLKVISLISLALVLVALPFMTACAEGPTEPQEPVILIGGCGVGGTNYPQSVALMKIVNEFVPGYNAVAQVTGCSSENARLLAGNKVFCALVSQGVSSDAFHAVGPFDGEEPLDLRLICYGSVYYLFVMTLDPDVTSMQEIKGSKVAVGDPGSANYRQATAVLNAAGLEENVDYEPIFLGETAAASALRDGIVSFWAASASATQASITELTTIEKVNFIGLTQQEAETAAANIKGRTVVTVAAGAYKGQDKDLTLPGGMGLVVTRSTQDEDLVYMFTKAMWEHYDVLLETHISFKDWKIERVATVDIGIPFHEGAIKYYKEAGILE